MGTYCHVNAQQIGICHPVDDHVTYCTVDMEDLPLWTSYYDPALGGINCLNDTCEHLGDGTPVKDGYGRYMACPPGMYGLELEIEDIGIWQCRDHGGMVVPRYSRVYTPDGFVTGWHLIADFLLTAPEWWTYTLCDFEVVE
jgi:hypothetical protein